MESQDLRESIRNLLGSDDYQPDAVFTGKLVGWTGFTALLQSLQLLFGFSSKSLIALSSTHITPF